MDSKLIHNARIIGEGNADAWVLILGDKIAKVGHGAPLPEADTYYDAMGAMVMPGVIDCHVHFREPGLTAKADIESESRAALAGGVTSYLDMPNTKPATVTVEAWEQKCDIAKQKSWANYGFFIGATNKNVDELLKADYTRVPGVKLFMGASTGNMLVDDDSAIAQLFRQVPAIVAVHAEDQGIISKNIAEAQAKYGDDVPVSLHSAIRSEEACCQCTKRAIDLAVRFSHRLHVCHLSTAREMEMISQLQPFEPVSSKLITSEVSPHHLLWCDQDYDVKGTRIKMNPAVKTDNDRQALRQALADGKIDMVATDHAPHLPADKQGTALTAASGSPMLQFSLPVMLELFDEATVLRTMCHNPAIIYGIKDRGFLKEGCYGDLVIVRHGETHTISDADVISKCGWTPVDGVSVSYRIEKTFVNGALSYCDGEFVQRNAAQLGFTPKTND